MTEKFVYAIGDIHGCLFQLKEILRKIEQDRKTYSEEPATIVFLGDYVDRGDSVKEVLDLLMGLDPTYHKFIKGNHEDSMVKNCTLKRYDDYWEGWGGKKTLESFGLSAKSPKPFSIPKKYIDWLENLPLSINTKTHFFCHAGIYPSSDLKDQYDSDLLWLRNKFLEAPANEFLTKKHIVHGHSIIGQVDTAGQQPHRTNLDAGCFETGVLMCGVFSNVKPSGPVRYLEVRGEPQSEYKGKPLGSWKV